MMLLHKDTPYKVVKYLENLSKERVLPKKFQKENFILFLIDRKVIEENNKQFNATKKFEEKYSLDIETTFDQCSSFIAKYDLDYLENHYSIKEFEALIRIDKERKKIFEQEISLQNILSQYFGSSKHKSTQSNLSKAIKTILGIESFPEERKDQQYISILYPKQETRFIFLCENKNRLIIPRHEYIEFWYAGGKNTKQLQFIPKPKQPIYYLFDWDFDGFDIYIRIKKNYFPMLKAFIPSKPELIMVKQDEVKKHRSKWKNKKFLKHLNEKEKSLAEILVIKNSIIEEQKILLTKVDLQYNLIGIDYKH
jgi:hypothetical protein